MEKTKSGLATASLVLGIVGFCTSAIPIINGCSLMMGILAIIFAIIVLAKKNRKRESYCGLSFRNTCYWSSSNSSRSLARRT